MSVTTAISFAESTARERVARLLDAGSFKEILGPSERVMSPHLAQLDMGATPAVVNLRLDQAVAQLRSAKP